MRKISKGARIEVDSLIMDLEDGVALNRKDEARHTITDASRTLDFGSSERLIRINPRDTPLFPDDLRGTIDARPDGYVLSKVETSEDVQVVSQHLAELEMERDWRDHSTRLLAMIETAKGVMNLSEIAQASQRLDAFLFGAEDLASDLGATRTRAGWEVFYGRSAVLTTAAAYGLQAIDTVFVDLNDPEGLKEECILARQLGYEGKMAIHPRQIEVIHRAFAPSPAEIEQAQQVVKKYAMHQAAGTGVFVMDGKMVDRPMVRAAEHLLEKARAAGLLGELRKLH